MTLPLPVSTYPHHHTPGHPMAERMADSAGSVDAPAEKAADLQLAETGEEANGHADSTSCSN
jgi:hypothetical protein